MIRKCQWCGNDYDTKHQSSIWCEDNPNRGRGEKRWRRGRKPRIATIGVMVQKPSPFWPATR